MNVHTLTLHYILYYWHAARRKLGPLRSLSCAIFTSTVLHYRKTNFAKKKIKSIIIVATNYVLVYLIELFIVTEYLFGPPPLSAHAT